MADYEAGQSGVYGILADCAGLLQSAAPEAAKARKFNRMLITNMKSSQTRFRFIDNLKALPIVLFAACLLSACAGDDEIFDLNKSITEAYVEAQDAVNVGNYRKAIGIFEALQARFPFSEFATQIQLELAYAYYKDQRVDQAIDAADTFLRENPTHQRVDYAMYIKALAYFDRGQTWLERMFRKDVNKRPPRDGELAFSLFSRLVERYPASEYSADAQQRMVYLKNRLAAYENQVARFYLERDAYVAALNRVRNALELYHGAESGSESLELMIQAYEGLGMTDLAEDTRRVLEKNFSDSPLANND